MFKGGLDATDGGMGSAANFQLASASPFSSAATALPSTSFGLVESPAHDVADSYPAAEFDDTQLIQTQPVSTSHWLYRYQLLLVLIDIVAAGAAATIAFVGRFGAIRSVPSGSVDIAFALAMPFGWVSVVALNRAYERRFIGVGTTEFERVFRAFLHLSVLTGFVAFVFKQDVARGFIVVALPLALVLDLTGRQAARSGLRRRRARGDSMKLVLAVGGSASVARFADLVRRDRGAGMRIVGACVPSTASVESLDSGDSAELVAAGVPVLGNIDSVRDAVRQCGARSVAVLSGEIDAEKLRWVSWQLEGTGTELVVSPGLTAIGDRRLHIQAIAGVPLLHISEPEFAGFRHVLKGLFDRVVAAVALLVLSPLLIGVALVVRCTSHGPALFCQTRVGKAGKPFRMIKFRSMYAGAERRVSELLCQNESADGLLFKIREDPRITRVGRTLRRLSLDELPQLINVVTGSMSLVGPRPPLPTEVERYGDDVRRRLLVKPGLTGLWQISGRSDLSWEESVRLDLHYVENWSLATDLFILFKTFRAVIRSSGAY